MAKNKLPTTKEIISTWNNFVLENKSLVERELALLSINQRKLLIFLASTEKTNELCGALAQAGNNLIKSAA